MDLWSGGLIAVGAVALALLVERRRQAARDSTRRDDALDRRDATLQERAKTLDAREEDLRRRDQEFRDRARVAEEEIARVEAEARRRLEEIARLTEEEAKKRMLSDLDRELDAERSRRIAVALESARDEADRRAREVVVTAIQRLATDLTEDVTVCRVPVESAEMRGRVIGREGRNVRAFEAATGCDVLVDDPPGQVTLSSFDPLRREVARRALLALLEDGRVQPARIEEVVADVRTKVEAETVEDGRAACVEAGVGDLHPGLVELLGRLKYRTSYGQNVLRHSIEAAQLAGLMASELGLDPHLARRAALLHDVGKAVDASIEGAHHVVAGEVARRFGEHPVVVSSIATSHDAPIVDSPYAVLAQVADAVSAARPGARREDREKFVRRVQDLEAVAGAFPGVSHAYAIRAGHEVRVIVDATKVSDATAPRLAFEIARAVEDRLQYPGEVKVTVVREVRAVEVAR